MLETCSYFNTGYPDPIGSHITSPDKQQKPSDPSGVAYLFHRLIAGAWFLFHFYVLICLFGDASKDLFYTKGLA
jgi:hypothetical protein